MWARTVLRQLRERAAWMFFGGASHPARHSLTVEEAFRTERALSEIDRSAVQAEVLEQLQTMAALHRHGTQSVAAWKRERGFLLRKHPSTIPRTPWQ